MIDVYSAYPNLLVTKNPADAHRCLHEFLEYIKILRKDNHYYRSDIFTGDEGWYISLDLTDYNAGSEVWMFTKNGLNNPNSPSSTKRIPCNLHDCNAFLYWSGSRISCYFVFDGKHTSFKFNADLLNKRGNVPQPDRKQWLACL